MAALKVELSGAGRSAARPRLLDRGAAGRRFEVAVRCDPDKSGAPGVRGGDAESGRMRGADCCF